MAKEEGFQKLCTSFSRLTPNSTVWNQVKGFQKGTNREQCHPSGDLNIEEYADFLCPVS
jgi:hypothetical protein